MRSADDTFTYITDYARLVRGVLESLYQKGHSLEEEVAWLRHYTRLESQRLGFPVTFTSDISADINAVSYLVPGLLIQPVVENALKHGIKAPKGEIRISAKRRNGKILEIAIFNTGKPWNGKPDDSGSLGLKLTIDRLSLLWAEKAPENVLEVQLPEDGNGIIVLLKLPENQNYV
jgi:LytS/YehU family sensor histidine kinase